MKDAFNRNCECKNASTKFNQNTWSIFRQETRGQTDRHFLSITRLFMDFVETTRAVDGHPITLCPQTETLTHPNPHTNFVSLLTAVRNL
jgi:hypothetical protein